MLEMLALLVALGATDEEAVGVFHHYRGYRIPNDPREVLRQARSMLLTVREEKVDG